MSKSILITTFGQTWSIIPEIIEFCIEPTLSIFQNNQKQKEFYDELNSLDIKQIDELWAITTINEITQNAINKINTWKSNRNHNIDIKYISLSNLPDLTSEDDCLLMSELIFRVLLKSYEERKKGGKIIISLAGGRKTMSSDIQRAAEIFGCDLLFHVADNGQGTMLNNENFTEILEPKKANIVFPIIIRKNITPNSILLIPEELSSKDYSIQFDQNNEININSPLLVKKIDERLNEATSLQFNFYKQRFSTQKQSVFYGILQLEPTKLSKLVKEIPNKEWIQKLPKIDLHTHLGGFFNPSDIVKIANANLHQLRQFINYNTDFANWHDEVKNAINNKDDNYLKKLIFDKNLLRNKIAKIPVPTNVIGFLNCFENHETYLEELIYGNYLDEKHFRNIGFEKYEQLGDLQGTALLQTKESLIEACNILKEYCQSHNIKYLELRCSPANYAKGNLNAEDVLDILYNNLYNYEHTTIRLIIIGSRHGDIQTLKTHVNLALNKKYNNFIVGFDIAGNEAIKSPAELRKELLLLMKNCIKLTIHAGENQPVENIWEAVYELNADRIGHGLTLIKNQNLMQKFRDRNIFIELCPSSNHQIANFDTFNPYPLRAYFDFGLKITINTDNPGISRTDITKEYLMVTENANLTKIELISLIRNSVQATFLPKDKKKQLMLKFEEEIFKILNNE